MRKSEWWWGKKEKVGKGLEVGNFEVWFLTEAFTEVRKVGGWPLH